MNAATMKVMTELPDIVIAYGISDEYRYLFLLTYSFRLVKADSLVLVLSFTSPAHFLSGGRGMTPLRT